MWAQIGSEEYRNFIDKHKEELRVSGSFGDIELKITEHSFSGSDQASIKKVDQLSYDETEYEEWKSRYYKWINR